MAQSVASKIKRYFAVNIRMASGKKGLFWRHGLETLDRVALLYDVINIKLDKTGGLTSALVLAEAARSKGLGLMMGCSSLSIAPAVHLAVGFAYIDLDGPIDLVRDVASGIVIDRSGKLSFDGTDQLWGGL